MRRFLLVTSIFVAVAALAACSNDDDDGDHHTQPASCVPGQAIACACPGNKMGVQICAADHSYGACENCEGATSNGGQGGSGGSGGSTASSGGGGAGGGSGGGEVAAPWSFMAGDEATQVIAAVAVDPNTSEVFAGGYFGGVMELPDATVVASGGMDIFLMKLSAGGKHIWSQRFGDPAASQTLTDVAVDSKGNVVAVGRFNGSIIFGNSLFSSTSGNDVYVLKLSSAGQLLWARHFAGTSSENARAVAIDKADNVLVAGTHTGAITIGGKAYDVPGVEEHAFVAKLDPNGKALWVHDTAGEGSAIPNGVVADSKGNVWVAGAMDWKVDFGGGVMTGAGVSDVYLLKLNGADGLHLLSTRYGDAEQERSSGIAVSGSDHIYVSGTFRGSIDFGSGALTSAGGDDVFVAAFASDGKGTFAKRFGGVGNQEGMRLAVDASGNVLVGGLFKETIGLAADHTSAGDFDSFLVKLDPQGALLSEIVFGGSGYDRLESVAVDSDGHPVLGGRAASSLDFGQGALAHGGDFDAFLAKLLPLK